MASNDQITVEELGRRTKAKYPVYASKSDTEVGQAVLAKYPQYKSRVQAPAPQVKPEERTFGNYAGEIASGVGRGVMDDVSGIAQTVAHPVKTVKDLKNQTMTAAREAGKEFSDTAGAPMGQRLGAAALTGLENAPMIGGMVQRAEEGGEEMGSPEAAGAAAEGITAFAAPEIAGKGIAAVTKSLPGLARGVAGTGPKTVRNLVKEFKDKNAAEITRAATEKDKTLAANKAADEKTLYERGVVDEKNAGLEGKNATGQSEAEQTKTQVARRAEAVKEHESVSSQLDVAVEKARHDALAEGNKKYSAVNTELNPIPADMDTVNGLYHEVKESLGEAQAEPPILKRIGKALEKTEKDGEDGEDGEGAELAYKDLQPIYSDLGKELSRGTLQGTVYHAYDVLHEGIGNEMQRIADEHGQGDALTEARAYWRRMKQTFGKSSDTVNNRAAKAVKEADPKLLQKQANDYRVRLLSSFDPKIGELANQANALRQEIASLPKKESAASPAARSDYSEPNPTKPIEKANVKKIEPEDVRAAKQKGIEGRQRLVEHKAAWMAIGPAFYLLHDILRGEMPSVGGTATAIAAPMAIQAAVTKILSHPKVVDFLTKATPADVAQIPPEIRGSFSQVAAQAKKRGIRVSPAFTAAAAAGIPTVQTGTDQGVSPSP